MRLPRTLTPIVFVLCLLVWSACAPEGFQAGVDAYNQGDYETAFKEWLPLAEQGEAEAQYNLGVLYDKGQGVPQDDTKAVRWYRLAAGQGNSAAQFNLGVMYANGQGVPQDDGEALRWYRLAAEQGKASAQNNLGVMYNFGQGVPQDDGEALRWYRLAAEQGKASAQNNLGVSYAKGQGVLQDYVQAHMWYNLAAAQNQESDATLRDGLADDMTPEQIAEAQRLAREWMAQHQK